MATVSAKMLSPSGSNLSTSKTIDTEKRTRLTVTRNSNPWIYSNYPEAIGKNGKGLALAENGYFLNQQTISGTAEVFYSHTNYTGKRLYVGIQAYNGSSKSVTVTCTNQLMRSKTFSLRNRPPLPLLQARQLGSRLLRQYPQLLRPRLPGCVGLKPAEVS